MTLYNLIYGLASRRSIFPDLHSTVTNMECLLIRERQEYLRNEENIKINLTLFEKKRTAFFLKSFQLPNIYLLLLVKVIIIITDVKKQFKNFLLDAIYTLRNSTKF